MRKHFDADEGYADVVIGMQFGDEAKARFVDDLARDYDITARFNGGPNAGHNIRVGDKEVLLRQVPSAVCYPHKQLYIGSGCAVNVAMLDEEIASLEKAGINVRDRLKVSSLATVIQPHHRMRDLVTMQAIGTTGNGMGAAYADQATRMEFDRVTDIRLGDLLYDFDTWFRMIESNLDAELQKLNMTPESVAALAKQTTGRDFVLADEMNKLRAGFERIRNSVDTDPYYLQEEIHRGMKVLLEGAQSIGLCNTLGTRPFTTASKITPGAAAHGAGVDIDSIRTKYGIVKAIPSRVGHGPFIGEFGGIRSENYWGEGNGYAHSKDEEFDKYGDQIDDMLRSGNDFDVGMALRMLGGEYGASKRPRRIGKLDLTFLRTHIRGLGIDRLFVSKMDQLVHFSKTRNGTIPIIREYMMDEQKLRKTPFQNEALRKITTLESELEGFDEDISGARKPEDLPYVVKQLIEDMQNELGATVQGIGVGKERSQYVELAR